MTAVVASLPQWPSRTAACERETVCSEKLLGVPLSGYKISELALGENA